jgi:hypothetical protein
VAGAAGDSPELIEDGKRLTDLLIDGNDNIQSFDWIGDGARHWLRLVLRTPAGRPVLRGNPIYVNF